MRTLRRAIGRRCDVLTCSSPPASLPSNGCPLAPRRMQQHKLPCRLQLQARAVSGALASR